MKTENPFKKLEFNDLASDGLQNRVFRSVELHKTLLEMANLFTTNAVNTMTKFMGGKHDNEPSKLTNDDENIK